MPITRPSAADWRFAIALTLIGAAGVVSLATAQVSPGAPDKDPPPSARAGIEAEGDAAMERLRGAIARRKTEPQGGPSELPQPTEAERRRAFEALRSHAPSPAMETRAREATNAATTHREQSATEADQLLVRARREAEQIVNAATKQAESIRNSGHADSERELNAIRAEVDRLTKRRDAITAQLGALRDVVAGFGDDES